MRTRHVALRAYETCGPARPAHRQEPRAVVQLRKENLRADSYNLVGFQNHLKFGEQARVLRLIPGLENARFLRYGQIHRNTYICAPALLDETLRLSPKGGRLIFSASAPADAERWERPLPTILFAGQISASKATPNRSPRVCWRGSTQRRYARPGAYSCSPGHSARLAGPLHYARGSQEL